MLNVVEQAIAFKADPPDIPGDSVDSPEGEQPSRHGCVTEITAASWYRVLPAADKRRTSGENLFGSREPGEKIFSVLREIGGQVARGNLQGKRGRHVLRCQVDAKPQAVGK